MPEIQDVVGPKRVAPTPTPTGKTAWPKWHIFGRDAPQGIQLRGTVVIFEFTLTSLFKTGN